MTNKKHIAKIKVRVRYWFKGTTLKKYYSCKHIEGGINFFLNQLRACCSVREGLVFVDNYKGEPLDWQAIQNKRKEVREILQSGQVYEPCKGCFELKEDYWQEKEKIESLFFFHWTHCNCGCTYCANKWATKGIYSDETKPSAYYSVLPMLKDLSEKNLIGENIDARIMGGEITVLNEGEEIIDLIMKHNPQAISFLTSGIKYSPKIAEVIKLKKAYTMISIDAGCRETYKKIKRVDKFDQVVENIKKYHSYYTEPVNSFVIKYILVENVNDNIEEIEKWLQLCLSIGVKNVRLDLDYCKFLDGIQSVVPDHYYELFEYIKNRTNELNLILDSYEFINKILEKKCYNNVIACKD